MNFFVKRYSKLYGEKELTFKLHCQLHLIKQVRNFGPLHRYSCFPFEGYFSIMKKYIHGTRGFVNQINNNHTIGLTIGNIPSILEEKDSTIHGEDYMYNIRVKDFYNSINNKNDRLFRENKIHNLDNNTKSILESFNINIESIYGSQRYMWKNKGTYLYVYIYFL